MYAHRMLSRGALLALFAAALGCEPSAPPAEAVPSPADFPEETSQAGPRWRVEVTSSGIALAMDDESGAEAARLACVRDPARMTVVVEAFRAIGSEERLSFGVDGEAFVFVADPMADRPSGVQAETAISGELLGMLEEAREVSAMYGAQQFGPHPAPDAEIRARFVEACREIAGTG
jgi:hypothetical protein